MVALHRTLLGLLAFASSSLAVNSVTVQGQDFVDTVTKNRVMIIGVDYQPGGQGAYDPNVRADALSNGTVCLRDAALLQRLGVNTIRVYNVDPRANHDLCASIFNTAGIYMIIDVNSPQQSINRADPASSYTLDYLTRIFAVVEAFKGYPNTMGFFSANEVMNDIDTGKSNPPYIRAVQRDLRQYIAKNSQRALPVGYSAADVRPILQDTWAYLQCNGNSTNDLSRSEFFGLNSYSWCGADATYQTAGYDQLVSMFHNSSIPVFFSEYGCNKPSGLARPFNEVQSLYGPQMTSLSGGLVYEYSQEESDYGLVVINANGSVSLRGDFDNLQNQYNKLNVTLLQSTAAGNTQITPPQCSASLITNSGFSQDFTVPAQPSGAAALINSGIPNPNRGKLISTGDLNVKQQIFSSSGKLITGIAVKAVSGANTPGGESTSGGSGSTGTNTASGTASPSASKKAAAASLQVTESVMTRLLIVASAIVFGSGLMWRA
ncbi:glycoside hydrolase family 72 protein [Venturia nashicola]|uniref:1,3-beta-glucanosyltransferase n=1 Tax=Venturia nashicola TaxID=86259 RepID=A0A4Z1PBB0_9PEZI|nr:glycoside hydrolase family 72 protein [Venturia nashicola]